LEKVWIIGRTGSGKTTILQAITRLIGFYKGSIKIFGNDYNEVSIEETRKEFSILSQDPFLFEGTLYENLDPNQQLRLRKLMV
jgi:ABC-type multidrug transport system fused ATPase/permease subunit